MHIHSPYTRLANGYGDNSVGHLAEKVRDSEISAIGVTNYFLHKENELSEIRDELDNCLIIPNIEFRVNNKNNEGDFINIHVLFNPEISPKKIKDNLNRLKLNNIPDENIYINQESIEKYPTDSITVSLDDLLGNLNEHFTPIDDFLIVSCASGYGNFRPDETPRFINLAHKIDKVSHLIFGTNRDRDFFLNKGEFGEKRYKTGLPIKPVLMCSDAHSINKVGEEYTWIKADPTYEGLKQILFEPELRVRIQKEDPAVSEKKIHISNFSLSKNSGYPIVDQEIDINRGLVSIIGGRGSGKSAFIETIAFCFNEHKSFLDEEGNELSKFSSGNETFIDYYLKNDADFDIELNFSSLDNETLAPYQTSFQGKEENCSYPILYLGQNRIEYFANDSERIHSLAYDTVIKNSSRSDQLNEYERTIAEKREKLINLNKKIEGLNEKIREFNEAELRDEKRRIVSEKELLTSKEVKSIIQTFNESRGKRDALKNLEELIGEIEPDNDSEENGSIKNLVENFVSNISGPIKRANELAKEIGYKGTELSINFEEFFESINNIKESIPKDELIESYKDSLEEVEENLKGKTDLSVSYLESLKSKENTIDEKLSNLGLLKAFREGKYSDRYRVLNDLEQIYSDYDDEYQSAINEFSQRNKGILKSIRLESKKEFDIKRLVQKIYNEVDRRKVRGVNNLVSDFLNLGNLDDFNFSSWIKEFKEDEANFDIFTNKSPEFFDSLVFEDYYNLITNIEYQISDDEYKSLDKLSLGQKGTVLLKFYLSSGNNCPILIDQPEDHLDNDFIYSDLVETIRNAKKKRQIIIVTHDANLVVNGDSEQVIIARYSDEKIDHALSGSLENPRIRKAVARILEGGDEAFKKRERKYSFK